MNKNTPMFAFHEESDSQNDGASWTMYSEEQKLQYLVELAQEGCPELRNSKKNEMESKTVATTMHDVAEMEEEMEPEHSAMMRAMGFYYNNFTN